MPEDKELQLLQELINSTREGKVAWHPTARLNEFTSSFKGRFSVLVGWEPVMGCYFRVMDGDDRELVSFYEPTREAMASTIGAKLFSATAARPTPLVKELYQLALRGALHVEDAIDEILQDLKQA